MKTVKSWKTPMKKVVPGNADGGNTVQCASLLVISKDFSDTTMVKSLINCQVIQGQKWFQTNSSFSYLGKAAISINPFFISFTPPITL